MSTLLSQITNLITGLRFPNSNGMTTILQAVDSAIDAADSVAATDAEAKSGNNANKYVTPASLRQGGALSANSKPMFLQNYKVAPAAVSATAVHAAMDLDVETQEILTGFTNPDFPRNVTVKGNLAGMAGNVVVFGTNFADAAINETIALNGVTEVAGNLAFKTVLRTLLPAETHAHAPQVETATVVGLVTAPGNMTVTITAAGMTGSGEAKNVAVVAGDDAAEVAEKIRTQLAADANVTALFDVSGENCDVVLTRKIAAANDATLNIALATGTATGITADATSTDTTAGVAVDTVSIGRGKKIGVPHMVVDASYYLLKLFSGAADAGTPTVDDNEIEKNVFDLAGTLDGAAYLDLTYLV